MTRRGFSLMELLVAILFVSIALFAFVSLFIRLAYSTSKVEIREPHREHLGQQVVVGLDETARHPSKADDVPNGPPGLKRFVVQEDWTDSNGAQTLHVEGWVREVNPAW